eukprot:TRINITY_DN708_c0_g1_i4.p1 TRINITY_DN708_c0_g1~~TRINITY_DN708_c0_g1_i4.p1  ORF type:complete len:456 (+),score=69.10 TRINITY_DN708_c0_g1_i4:62-1429(+)
MSAVDPSMTAGVETARAPSAPISLRPGGGKTSFSLRPRLGARDGATGVQVARPPAELLEHMRPPSPRSEPAAGRPSGDYVCLADALRCTGRHVSFYAVVVSVEAPKATRGTDLVCCLRVADPSLPESNSLRVMVFGPDAQSLPQVERTGDIICLHKVKMQMFEGSPQGIAQLKFLSRFLLFAGSSCSATERFAQPYWPPPHSPSRVDASPSNDLPNVKRLQAWAAGNRDRSGGQHGSGGLPVPPWRLEEQAEAGEGNTRERDGVGVNLCDKVSRHRSESIPRANPPVPQSVPAPTASYGEYVCLADAVQSMGHSVAFYAVVVSVEPSKQTRGTDLVCGIRVADPSLPESASLRIMVFGPNAQSLPQVERTGDVIRLQKVKMQMFEGSPQGIAQLKFQSRFLLFPFSPSSTAGLAAEPYFPPANSISRGHASTSVDLASVERLREFATSHVERCGR